MTGIRRSVLGRGAVLAAALVLWAAVVGVGSACGGEDPAGSWLPSEPLKGRIVFEQKHCNTCHSIGGAGGGVGPDLTDETFGGTFLDLASSLWNHIPDMVVEQKTLRLEWPRFTDEEVVSLISYLYYLRYLGTPGDVASGKKLFRSKGCDVCHTVGKEKGGDVGPKLDRLMKYASPIYMIQAIWNHGPRMQQEIHEYGIARPAFTGQDISDLSAYIRSISEWTVQEKIYVSPGDPNDGKQVFAAKGCARCHAVRGDGGDIGPALDDVDLSRSVNDIAAMMWNHAEEMLAAMGQERIEWPTFEGKEMADLIAYLYFMNFVDSPGDPVRGERLFGDRQCSSCHSIRGKGGEVGPDLSESAALASSVTILRSMFNHAAKMSETVLSEGKTWPLLTGSDMRDIFSYLRSTQEGR